MGFYTKSIKRVNELADFNYATAFYFSIAIFYGDGDENK